MDNVESASLEKNSETDVYTVDDNFKDNTKELKKNEDKFMNIITVDYGSQTQ